MGALWQSEPTTAEAPSERLEDVPPPKSPRKRRVWWRLLWPLWLLLLIALIAVGFAIAEEMQTSRLQSREFSHFAATLSYSMHKGPSDAIMYPGDGPFDKRLGYSALGDFLPRLLKRDYLVSEQTRFSVCE